MAGVVEGFLEVKDTDEVLDTTVIEQLDGTEAHREAVVIADPETTAARQKVTNAGTERWQP